MRKKKVMAKLAGIRLKLKSSEVVMWLQKRES